MDKTILDVPHKVEIYDNTKISGIKLYKLSDWFFQPDELIFISPKEYPEYFI